MYMFNLLDDQHVIPWPILGIVDTGAAHLMLHIDYATDLKLDLDNATPINVVCADGYPVPAMLRSVRIEMLGHLFDVLACFGPFTRALIGQSAINEIMRFGTDDAGWLWTLDRTVT